MEMLTKVSQAQFDIAPKLESHFSEQRNNCLVRRLLPPVNLGLDISLWVDLILLEEINCKLKTQLLWRSVRKVFSWHAS
jgi:hypothetical protein